MDIAEAQRFAHDWVSAWNDHDLDAILSHYAPDIVFRSPRIRDVTGADVDFVTGHDALRAYWGQALSAMRDLYFAVDRIYLGAHALTLVYTNHRQQSVAETFVFGPDGKVRESIATYS